MPLSTQSTTALRCGFQNFVDQASPVACKVVFGVVPEWLRNSALYRTSPGMFDIPSLDPKAKHETIRHWFDGLGVMHQFNIRSDGSVWYHNKLIATGALEAIQAGANPILFGPPLDPCVSIFGKVAAMINTVVFSPHAKPEASNLNVTVSKMPYSLVPNTVAVKSDFNMLQLVDADTFETKRFVKYSAYDDRLAKNMVEYDPVTDTYFNLNIDFMGNHTAIFSLDSGGAVREAVIHTPRDRPVSYIHSFSSTTKYLVLTTPPAFLNGLKVLYEHSYSQALTWQREKQCLFYVVDRATMTHVATFESTDAFFFFHSVNAFDDGDDIVLDMIHHTDMDIIHRLNVRTILEGSALTAPSRLARFRLRAVTSHPLEPPKASPSFPKVELPQLWNTPSSVVELPTINERYRHNSQYRFVYAVGTNSPHAAFFEGVVKMNLDTGEEVWWLAGDGQFVGEPIFVPHPQAEHEDDGVLLSVVLDGIANQSHLVVLNARDLSVVAKVASPVVVPLGFHGMHTAK
ncbi:hypothetical protein DYB26_004507 [Aphanomyces astaci]|uniref:Uncharacterized protein n=1 Tax=Aphanomyces astaci TaxID=112090 RepID=A0A397CUG2_APHAT|nr:hypothetical protein DYB34_006489 [Aphanomyces astaci]RHY52102.1 hypothetical protein DYB38_008110 [Aphanomyces astaci]RHZ22980.1 hypothetical protein DYB26_004507 [Aphanomyces astaci]